MAREKFTQDNVEYTANVTRVNKKGMVWRKPSRCATETDKQGVLVNTQDVSYWFVGNKYYFRERIAARDDAAPAACWIRQTRDGVRQPVRGTCHTFICHTKDKGSGFACHVPTAASTSATGIINILPYHLTARLRATCAVP